MTTNNATKDFWAGQPQAAPVHKVASKSPFVDVECELCDKPHTQWLIDPADNKVTFRCDDHPIAPVAQPVPPPARVWIGLEHGRVYSEMIKGTIEYAHLAPIQEALLRCRAVDIGTASEATAQVIIRKSDWDALIALVKGR